MAGTEGTIVAHANACIERFNELSMLEARDDHFWAEDQNARFHLWTMNIGVFASGHASSDHRLEQHSEVFQVVGQLLQGIEANLKQLILQHQENPDKAPNTGNPDIEEEEEVSSSKSSSLHSTTSSSDCPSKPAIDSRAQIEVTIRRLNTVARSIRHAGMQNRDTKAEAWIEKDNKGHDLTSFFTHLARVVMEYKFPDASPSMRLRLAQSEAQRRNRIAYTRRHQQKLDKKPPLARKQEVTPASFISGKKMSLPAPSLISVSKRSNSGAVTVTSATSATQADNGFIPMPTFSAKGSSRASTVISGTSFKGGDLIIPDPPDVTNKEHFQCPYCAEICPANEAAGTRWRHHLMRDLRPYICTFEPCSSPTTAFRTINDWVLHIQQDHPLTNWLCAAPIHGPQTFDTQALYEEHMLEEHAGTFLREELPGLARLSLRSTVQVFKACPFCTFIPEGDGDNQSAILPDSAQINIQKHVASHLESLSLLSLHWLNEDKDSSSVEDSSIKVRADLLRKSEPPPIFHDPPVPDVAFLYSFDLDWKEPPPVFERLPHDPAWVSRYGADENQNPPRLTYEWGFRWKDNIPPYEGHENDKNLVSFPDHTLDSIEPTNSPPHSSMPSQASSEDRHPTTWATRIRSIRRMFSRTPERNANPLDQPTPRPLYKDATSDLVSRPNREDDFITSTEYSRRPLDYSLSPPSPENDVPELRFSRTSSNDGNDSSDIPRIRVITSSPSPSFHSYDASERGQITSGSFDTAAHVDFSNFSSAGGLLESTTSHDSETSDQSPPTLEDQLWDCRIEWPPQQNTYFVPIDEMKRLVTLSSITMELQRRGTIPDRLNQSDAVEFTQRILATALRLFAILTVIGKSDAILDFLEEGLGDDDLPFVRVDLQFGGSNMSLGSRLRPEIRMKCILRWTRMEISNFLRDQWWMLAPVFKSPGGRVRHYMLDDFFILPYIQDEQHSGRALSGGYSSVWLVKIHPAHQKFYPENHNHVNPPFAIKRLHSTKQEDFKLEVEMLKVFSNGDHPHLIRLLATYEYKGSYFLIFPWAQANLRGYWEANPNMKRTPSSLLWVLRQCRGLSSGLLHIHEYQSTSGPFQDINKQEHLYGRHGDIKPENILFLALDGTSVVPEENYGNLALADFGLTEFHNIKTRTRSLTRGTTTRGTPTYAPPEVALRQKISRAYDIWSLGCVFLELISWVVCGTEGLWQFQEGRGETNSDGFINDDVFYTIVRNQEWQSEIEHATTEEPRPSTETPVLQIPKPDRHAIVRTSVQEWMRDLHEKPVASQFVHDFVDLISQSMLVVEPAERSRIGPLVGKLQAMIDKAEADPSYLIESVPYPPREVAASNFIGTRPSSPSQKVIFSEG